MSGVDKSQSAMLSYGRANKARYSSGASDMFDNLGEADHSRVHTTEHSWAGPSRSHSLNMNVNFDRNGNSTECTSDWNMKGTQQMGGLTFSGSYDHGNGKMTGMVDWGEIYPNLNFFQGLE